MLSAGLVALGAATSMAAGPPKRVLILLSFGRDVAPFTIAVSAFRTTLADELGEPVDVYEESLDIGRFADPAREQALADLLAARFADRPPDIVVPFGAPAAKFVATYSERLFARIPRVFTAVDPRLEPPESSEHPSTLVTQQVNFGGIIEDILQMRPDTTDVAVVFGSSQLEKFWLAETRREFAAFEDRLRFTWLSDLTQAELLKRGAELPPHTFILFGMFLLDAAGVPCDNEEALRRLHDVSNAPVFGYFDSEFGFGAIGGHLYQATEVGSLSARTVIRVLRGENAQDIAPRILETVVPRYDWRELRRWNVDESRLPAERIVEFREPTTWEAYGWWIIGFLTFAVLETALLILLLVNRARRRSAEATTQSLLGRLIRAHEDERSRLARELHDDLTQRLARASIDAAQLQRMPREDVAGAAEDLRDDLARLGDDVHSLSYRLHPSILEDLGLVEAVRAECDRFTSQEGIPVETELEASIDPLPADAALCLFRIVQEGLRNVGRHANAKRVEICLRRERKGLELALHDDGVGFDPAENRGNAHLGLASMKERVLLLGGELRLASRVGKGTSIFAWVPLEAAS